MTGNRRYKTTFPVRLRVALIAGTLGQAGAEKQLVYMARALRDAGLDLQVYCLTKGEFYEAHLRELGLEPRWFGRFGNIRFANIPLRLASLTAQLRRFKPHIVQSDALLLQFVCGPEWPAVRCPAHWEHEKRLGPRAGSLWSMDRAAVAAPVGDHRQFAGRAARSG